MIFNSLGSNYNFQFVLKTLLSSNSAKNRNKLIAFLDSKYDGNTILTYKGREALKLSLDLLSLPKGVKVGITGFTCFAVYKAVVDSGCTPVFLDIHKENLNFDLNAIKKHNDLKAVVVQNTLGNPCDILKIKKYCVQKNIILIEDLAHCIGSVYKTGLETGSYGDFVVLSFGQDKVVDSVSGGALIVKNKKFIKQISSVRLRNVAIKNQFKDRLYPFLTYIIRKTYNFGLGKLLHFLLKKTRLLSTPFDGSMNIVLHNLPNWYCGLVLHQFNKLDDIINHRAKISKIYRDKLGGNSGFNLRFPFQVPHRNNLLNFLKSNGVYVSDIWYDSPIAPVRLLKYTSYSGECVESEEIVKNILNLPTHINVSKRKARWLANKILEWINIQQKK